MGKNTIMTHLVAGYPTMEFSKKIALAMAGGGAAYLEIQFPFSDPIADGPLIQAACTESIAHGFTVNSGFKMIKGITAGAGIPVFLMTYANLAVAAEVREFVRKAKDSGVSGLIIPDLPFDYDEDLYAICREMDIISVPVVVQGISVDRLEKILNLKPEYVYAAVRKGITGKKSVINSSTISFLESISKSGIKVLAGFGIREREQVVLLAPHVHCTVVGSALVQRINHGTDRGTDIIKDVRSFVSSLC